MTIIEKKNSGECNNMRKGISLIAVVIIALAAASGCKKKEKVVQVGGEKILEIGAVAVAGSTDPNDLGSMYDLDIANLVYDTLYEYEYLARPFKLKPAMTEAMPEVSKDGLTYTFKITPGQMYIDDKCFEKSDGKGRDAEARDFITNLYRKADLSSKSQNWWLVSGLIEGLDGLRKKYKGKAFDYDSKIPGLVALDKYTVQMKLIKPFPQIMWVLAMPGLSPYPLECAQYYGEDFGNHPVGTGPFKLESWQRNAKYTLVRNEKYRQDTYPSEGTDEDRARGLLKDSGKRLPFADKVIVHEFTQRQPYWLQFRAGKFAWGRVPNEFVNDVFKIRGQEENTKIWEKDGNGQRVLTDDYSKYSYYPLALLDFIYRGFNYEDPIVGGEKGKLLRQAISLAHNIEDENDKFYNGLNKIYSGVIPPGVGGFDPDVPNPYKGPDLKRAKELLAKAGYPGGKGLPELQLCGAENASTMEQAANFIRNAKKIGVTINYQAMRFAELSKKLKQKRCQMMGLAWGGDWPDAQNFIQLMYGPNASPGSNNTNYNNPAVNKIYDKASIMADSPERNALYQQMNRLVIEDVPFMGSMARTRDYLIPADTSNFKPEEMIHTHAKFVRLKSWGE